MQSVPVTGLTIVLAGQFSQVLVLELRNLPVEQVGRVAELTTWMVEVEERRRRDIIRGDNMMSELLVLNLNYLVRLIY